jgi:membrane protease YdiL (CAAX protease family)
MRAIFAYVAVVYGLSIALSLLIGLTGGHESRLVGLSYLSMLLPAIAVALVYTATKEAPLVCWKRFPWSYLPIALFLMPAVLHLTMLPVMAAIHGGLRWQGWLSPQLDGLYHTPPSRGWGVLTTQGLVGHIVFNAIFGLAFVSFMAFFEEIGWRAWLLPRLEARIGARRAVVAVAILWALWHVPFELSGILHVDGVSPLKLEWVLPPGTMASGLILGWLWLRTESIWIVAIAHGALNNWGQYAFKYMNNSAAPDMDLVVLSVGSLGLMVAGAFLLWRDTRCSSRT